MRTWKKKFFYGVLLVALIGAGTEVTTQAEWIRGPENWYYDFWHQLAGLRYVPRHVVIVAIDDQTRLEHLDEPLMFWSPYFARTIQVLRTAGATVIGLDYLFSVSAESWLRRLKLPESEKSRIFDLPFREQLASGKVVLASSLVMDAQGRGKVLLPLPDYWGSLPGKLEDVGLANFYNDADGVIRRFVPALSTEKGEAWVTFDQLLAERAVAGGAPPPAGLTPIGFTGPPGTVPRISFRQLLKEGAERDPEILAMKGKVVIIASEPTGFQDIHMTPYARSFLTFGAQMMSGAEVHGNIVETMLTGRFSRPVAALLRVAFLAVILALGTALFFRLSPLRGLAALGLLSVLVGALAYLLFTGWLILPVFGPQVGLGVCYLGVLGFRLTREERERARLRQLFGRYVSAAVVDKLVATGKPPDLGGEAITVTVLFSDIRNFTTFSESLSPHQVVELLNTYFTRVCDPILEQGGCVDKFMGDAVMAVFGSPVPQPDHAPRALKAALAMAQIAAEFRAWVATRFPDQGLPEFHIGIGVHTGQVVVGNIGSPTRLDFTAIGDTVNTASRLEGLTKELGWAIVASSSTVAAARPGVVTGGHQTVQVKGRQEAVEVFEVTGLEA